MEFDNRDLVILVDQKYRNHREFAAAMGWTDQKTSYKLKSLKTWTVADVGKAIEKLCIRDGQIKRYFFTPKVQEN